MERWDPLSVLTKPQLEQLEAFAALLREANRRLNLISRDTVATLEDRHLRHSLYLGWRAFPKTCRVVDWGSGGGLPAIPLAIRFPDVAFTAIDAVGKKVQAVRYMARRLGLDNLEAVHSRAEQWEGTAHFSVSRATAPLATLWGWHLRVFSPWTEAQGEGTWPQGLICLKGGDLRAERAALTAAAPNVRVEEYALEAFTRQAYFADKRIVSVHPPYPSTPAA